jgi:hypothetical protein
MGGCEPPHASSVLFRQIGPLYSSSGPDESRHRYQSEREDKDRGGNELHMPVAKVFKQQFRSQKRKSAIGQMLHQRVARA